MKNSSFYFLLFIVLISCQEKAERSDAYGNFETTATTISSEIGGQLLFLNVQEGEKLPAGKLVALVDTTLLDLQRKQIDASIQTLPKKLRNTLADIEVLQKQKSNLQREQKRLERLVERKAATSKQLDDLRGQVELVDKQMDALRAQTDLSNRAILSEKEPLLAQINVINEKIKKSYIINPAPGTVLTKITEAFEVVAMGTPLYRIANLDTMTLRCYVDAVQLQNITLGDEVQVLIDSGKKGVSEYSGYINWISEIAEFTPKTIQTKEERVSLVYALKLRVPNPEGYLKIGMPAEVNFLYSKKETTD